MEEQERKKERKKDKILTRASAKYGRLHQVSRLARLINKSSSSNQLLMLPTVTGSDGKRAGGGRLLYT